MKKSTKGAVAAGAAATLLLGGAGSLAYWNASGTIDGGSVSSGTLTLTAADTGTWKLNGTTVSPISSVKVVPGDELVYTGSYTIGATGNNIQGNLAVSGGTGSAWTGSTITTTYKLDGTTVTGTTPITGAQDGKNVSAEIKIDFPFGTTADNTSQSKSVSLSNVGVTLTQTDATP